MTEALTDCGQPIDQLLLALGTDRERGLTGTEARLRLQQHGYNELKTEPPPPAWKKFLAQFKDLLVILLLAATVLSAAMWFVHRESALPYEAIAIFSIILLNAVMGYIQEARAERSVAALRRLSAARSCVIRDGARQTLSASELVPGDLILLEEGDTIPADARLLQAIALQTMEAALTGESLPVAKDTRPPATPETALADRQNMVFSSTAVVSGRGKALVTATGMNTEIGRIAGMLAQVREEPTPLQKELNHVGRLLGITVLLIAAVMIATLILLQHIRGLSALLDALLLGVALAVAAVPEGLPAIVTAVLALGVQRMAKRNAILRHLAAVETLGSADVIASDKTGTLTKNEMTVRTVVTASGRAHFTGSGYSPEGRVVAQGDQPPEGALRSELRRILTAGDRASNAVVHQDNGRWTVQGDPTEGALVVAALKAGLQHDALDARFERVGELPFSSERKLMSTIHTDEDRHERLLVFTKGAPDVLLARCSRERVGEEYRLLSDQRRAEILATIEELARQALRTLGIAVRELPANALDSKEVDEELEQELIFLGLVGMIDPPRDESKEAVARARRAGIRPIMITGDHPVTAAVIATELGIAHSATALTGSQLEKLSDDALAQAVLQTPVCARVNPEHKLRIVKALQTAGATVAMTGDGVNDAPALKLADIGIAMGVTGTDVSREAADVVLTDDNFATIVSAVEEGRAIFANIRKFLRYLLSSNIGEVMTMFLGVLFASLLGLQAGGNGLVLPLLATQILWINLLTDGPPALALGVEPPDRRRMKRPPRPRTEGLITPRMWAGIFFIGLIMAAGTLFVLDSSLPGGLIEGTGTVAYAQTMAFTTLILFQLFNVFNARSDQQSAFRRLFRNPWLWVAIGLSLGLQVAVVYFPLLQKAFSTVPLDWADWLRCGAVASSVLWLRELSKLASRVLRRIRA